MTFGRAYKGFARQSAARPNVFRVFLLKKIIEFFPEFEAKPLFSLL
jgi:hypothetical protein